MNSLALAQLWLVPHSSPAAHSSRGTARPISRTSPAALFGVLAVFCGVRFLNTGSVPSAVGAGVALRFPGIKRPFSAVLIVISRAIELLRRACSLHYRRLAWFFLGSFPFVTGFRFYNNAVTGSPLLAPSFIN